MPLLSSLQFLSKEILGFFASQGIDSVETFLARDIESLPGLDDGTSESAERRKALADIMSYLETMYTTGVQSGDSFLQWQCVQRFVPTGCESLDCMLNGGLLEGTVTELVGASASGKTQLCMQAAATVAYERKASVAYMDTTNSFSAKRTANMLGGRLGTREKIKDAQSELKKAMSNIHVYRVYSIYSLFNAVQELDTQLKRREQENDVSFRLELLVVDSASSLVSPILTGRSPLGHSLMRLMGSVLKKIAYVNNLAVLITNHTVSGEDGHPKPALGESWKSVPHVRLLLERDSTSTLCRATVLQHTAMATMKQATFRLGRGGFSTVDGAAAARNAVQHKPGVDVANHVKIDGPGPDARHY